MTNKEALNELYEYIDERLYEFESDRIDSLRKQIYQALNRLEELEKKDKKWQELFGCDLCEVLGREILLEENAKLKKVIGILEKRLGVKIKVCINGGCSISILVNDRLITPNNEYLKYIDKEEYKLLREVLDNATN